MDSVRGLLLAQPISLLGLVTGYSSPMKDLKLSTTHF